MFSFIPQELYYDLYINLCLFLVLFTILHTLVLEINNPKNLVFVNIAGYILLVVLILFIGQRPIYAIFGDTVNYAVGYQHYYLGGEIEGGSDYGFQLFMKFVAGFGDIHVFFTICAFLYIFPLYRVSKQLFNEYWYYAFIFFVVSFSFWTYGVNGVRNGVATSLFLWGISYRKNIKIMIVFFLFSASFHKTLLLPIMAFTLTNFFNNPKIYFKMWLLCIPLSLTMGGLWISLFASLGFDDRLSGYLTSESASGTFSSTGFRWDFLFHSAFAVFAGWYFLYKKKYYDQFYYRLLNTYLICNSFWILVIKANYSNRFAYLSWFLMALIIVYPFLKEQFFKNHHFMIGKVMLFYFSFTYLMYYIYYF